MMGPAKLNAGVRFIRKGRWTRVEANRLKRAQQENPEATMGELANVVWSRNAKQVRDRLSTPRTSKAKPTPAKRFSGYKLKKNSYDWTEIRRERKSNTYLSMGKVSDVNADGSYEVTLHDGEVHNVSVESIQKLSGTRRNNDPKSWIFSERGMGVQGVRTQVSRTFIEQEDTDTLPNRDAHCVELGEPPPSRNTRRRRGIQICRDSIG